MMPVLEELIREKGFDIFVPFRSDDPKEIFERDYKELKSSDILVAEVSETSHGVGMEIGLSYEIGLKRILLLERGKYVTKFAQGMPKTEIIIYENIQDLKEKLNSSLDKIKIIR
ncbi:nucleoside 2-deoxyribosyltransferase [Patescibacteria group bacterium]|nr:nucleoside 2-deoxyribosyltransferase [Patescibacteria group bacterium]